MEHMEVGRNFNKKIKYSCKMNSFVFVVCGGKEHIETLNMSLKFINHFSKFAVTVVTDTKRNFIPIAHNNILDIQTPKELSHHEASIFLKTSLHKHLNMDEGNVYCYLDSDVVAIDDRINTIFDLYKGSVLFANDHCTVDQFSPFAMNCSCLHQTVLKNAEYDEVDKFFAQKIFAQIKNNEADQQLLQKAFDNIAKKNLKAFYSALVYYIKRYVLPISTFQFGGFYFNKKDNFWYNKNNDIICSHYPYFLKKLYKKKGIRFDKKTGKWYNAYYEEITPHKASCNHFTEYAEKVYNVKIPINWQHWNGGVFLFNKDSVSFLDYWHRITLEEFKNPYTKTRDQGTLAIAAWKFGLQNTQTLPKVYNFIAEIVNPLIDYSPSNGFTNDGFKTLINPCFLHVFHGWGHKGWPVWDFIEDCKKKLSRNDK